MSTARFNTLTDASGGNSMPVADINQGRAKAWFRLNGNGTIADIDSFNTSSYVDNAVGDYNANWAVVFANALYTQIMSGDNVTAGGNRFSFLRGSDAAQTASTVRFGLSDTSIVSADGYVNAVILGDR